jgi:Translocation protein Sec62
MIEAAPPQHQMVGATGMYMWVNKESGWKQYIYLGLAIFGAFFILLFKVWPEWLRLGVWYVSWYLLVFLVSATIFRTVDWCGHRSSDHLVLCVPHWCGLLDFP